MEGISSRQGLHQVAQKFRNTTFPRKSDRRMSLSFKSGSLKSGATLPTGRGSYLELCIHTTPNTSARMAIDTRTITSFDCTRGAVCSTGVVIDCSAIDSPKTVARISQFRPLIILKRTTDDEARVTSSLCVSVQAGQEEIHAPETEDHHQKTKDGIDSRPAAFPTSGHPRMDVGARAQPHEQRPPLF